MLKSFSFENEVVFKIISPDKLYNKTFKKNMLFVPWCNTRELKTNDFKSSVIYRLYGPFHHKKYRTYNE